LCPLYRSRLQQLPIRIRETGERPEGNPAAIAAFA